MNNISMSFPLGLALGITLAFILACLDVTRTFTANYHSVMQYSISNTDLRVDTLRSDSVVELPFHKDDDRVAKELAKKVRVLIWVMTSPKTLVKKAAAVKRTWGKRADTLLFMSSEENADFPTIGLNVSEGREHLTEKTMQAFRYVYDNHFDDADWFMKVDDDTFVIVENLRYFLSYENHSDPVFFGHHFKPYLKQGYYSGGGGYVLSKEALRRMVEKGVPSHLCRTVGGIEDLDLGSCMENIGVRTKKSTDALGRRRFHCFDLVTHVGGFYPKWYYRYDANGAQKGKESISDYAISFHYVGPDLMELMETQLYHLRPYGIKYGLQDLNVKH